MHQECTFDHMHRNDHMQVTYIKILLKLIFYNFMDEGYVCTDKTWVVN